MAENDNLSFFKNLKKLFNSSIIVRTVKTPDGKKLKVVDTDNLQSVMSNVMRDKFMRINTPTSGYYSKGGYNTQAAHSMQRISFFRDYEIMDLDPILASALDIYSEETTVHNEYDQILQIQTDNMEIKELLHNLFYDILNIEFNLQWWIRNMCKYGDTMLFLEISPQYGIHNVLPLSVYDTFRHEGENPNNPYEVYFEAQGLGGKSKRLENYEIAHFRLIADGNFLPYGRSVLEPARRLWRQLTLMEDAMIIHRIMRAPEKRKFKIDIGNIPPNEVDMYITKIMEKSKKTPFINPADGQYNLDYNMQNILEDFYIPVRGKDSGTDIENLGGLEYNSIDDIEYLKNKMFAALKIPKAFMGYEEGISGKTTLAAEDVRFSRTIERIQKIVVSELTKMAIIHLYSQGYTDEELTNFSLSLTSPSIIYEQEKISLWKEKIGLATEIINSNVLSTDWIYENVMNLSDDEVKEERERIVTDSKRAFRYDQLKMGASDPAKFGYPQNAPPPMPGAEMPGIQTTDSSINPATSANIQGQPMPGQEQPQQPVGESSVGRPSEGMKYGKDSHFLGRDPLGNKDNHHAVDDELENPKNKKKSDLSIESINMSDEGTFLDENVFNSMIDKQL